MEAGRDHRLFRSSCLTLSPSSTIKKREKKKHTGAGGCQMRPGCPSPTRTVSPETSVAVTVAGETPALGGVEQGPHSSAVGRALCPLARAQGSLWSYCGQRPCWPLRSLGAAGCWLSPVELGVALGSDKAAVTPTLPLRSVPHLCGQHGAHRTPS